MALPCLHVGLFADYAEIVWDRLKKKANCLSRIGPGARVRE
jgi:hypothetical protein